MIFIKHFPSSSRQPCISCKGRNTIPIAALISRVVQWLRDPVKDTGSLSSALCTQGVDSSSWLQNGYGILKHHIQGGKEKRREITHVQLVKNAMFVQEHQSRCPLMCHGPQLGHLATQTAREAEKVGTLVMLGYDSPPWDSVSKTRRREWILGVNCYCLLQLLFCIYLVHWSLDWESLHNWTKITSSWARELEYQPKSVAQTPVIQQTSIVSWRTFCNADDIYNDSLWWS